MWLRLKCLEVVWIHQSGGIENSKIKENEGDRDTSKDSGEETEMVWPFVQERKNI